jgi:L-alanine-DL-glutamate epimerase-like enolase superfamily enzyme
VVVVKTASSNGSDFSRRAFLQGMGASLLATLWAPARAMGMNAPVGGLRIERIDLFAVRYPMTGHFKFFTGPHGAGGRASVLVKITTDEGLVGWGQSVPIARWSYETLETATIVLRDYYAPALLGYSAHDLEGAHQRMTAAVANGFTTGMPIARAGIDLALHDLAGKEAGKSVAELWRRTATQPLELSWTLNPRNLDETAGLIEAGRARGYRHFNIKVSPDPDFDVELAKITRQHAPDAFLWADANGGYSPEAALAAAPRLADAGVDVLEAPMQPNQIRGYQELRKQGALPILMDEGVISPTDLREFYRLGMLDGVAMKPSRCGGLVSARAQIEYLISNDLMWLGSGLTDPDVSLAATLQLYGAYGLKKPAALNGHQFVTDSLLKKPLEVVDGKLLPPTGPGFGVEIDEEKLAALVAATESKSKSSHGMSTPLRWEEQDGKSLALHFHGEELWRFNYDRNDAFCYFHPLALPGIGSLTEDQPGDHVHHHGLWFSWKYINGVNFWENASGKDHPAGRSKLIKVRSEAFDDYAARFHLTLEYQLPDNTTVLREERRIDVSPPAFDGSYSIEWSSQFTAIAETVKLDRTPLPGEPGGVMWGGYAGLALRLSKFEKPKATSGDGELTFNKDDRYRGRHTSFQYSGQRNGRDVAITVTEIGDNLQTPTPWYAVASSVMNFFTPAVICFEAQEFQRGESFTLHYRIQVHHKPWSSSRLTPSPN